MLVNVSVPYVSLPPLEAEKLLMFEINVSVTTRSAQIVLLFKLD